MRCPNHLVATYIEFLGSFTRVLWYDKRGTEVFETVPLASLPTIEQWTDDGRTVMDAVGVELGGGGGGGEGEAVAAMLAACHPRARARRSCS